MLRFSFSEFLNRLPHHMLILAMVSTILNILCGIIGILILFFNPNPVGLISALRLLLLGGIFDFLDGRFARMSPTKSDIGTYADSFGDVVTFALLPGYVLLISHVVGFLPQFSFGFLNTGLIIGIIFAVSCWFRLVRYAIKPTGVTFAGLPAPVGALLIVSGAVVSIDPHFLLFSGGWVLTILALFSSIMMVSHVTYPTPKRMLTSDTFLIGFAGLTGILNIFFPSTFAALLMFLCAMLYTFFGPLYQRSTENLQVKALQKEPSGKETPILNENGRTNKISGS